jgi:hypothetical protein
MTHRAFMDATCEYNTIESRSGRHEEVVEAGINNEYHVTGADPAKLRPATVRSYTSVLVVLPCCR